LRPSRGLRSGATRSTASQRQHGPLVRLRGTSGTQTRPRSNGYWFRSTRTAFRRPPGSCETRPAEPTFAGRRPPLRFRSSSEVHRSTPAPSREPEGSLVGRCFLSWAFVPFDTCRGGGPVAREASSSAASHVRGFDPLRGVHHRPSRAFRRGASVGFTLQGVLLEAIGSSCEGPCLRGVGRVDSPRPHGERADAVAFKASIPLRARSAVPDPEGPGAPMPSWAFPLQSTHPASVVAALIAARSPRTRWVGLRRPVPPASQGVAERETWPPLSGWPTLVGFVTEDRREAA